MKRYIFILLALCGAFATEAQNCDTLFFGMREPTIYYYGTHWIDRGVPYEQVNMALIYDINSEGQTVPQRGSREMARRFNVIFDEGLDIIGLAGVFRICNDEHEVRDTVISHRVPEYLKLWLTTKGADGEDSIYAVDSVQWENKTPRYRMEFINTIFTITLDPIQRYYPFLWEAYLDIVWHITDSFYVGATAYNNETECLDDIMGAGPGKFLVPYTQIFFSRHRNDSSDIVYERYRYFQLCPGSIDLYLNILHYDPFYWGPRRGTGYTAVFPIFDTTGHIGTTPSDPEDPSDTISCPNVHGFRIMEQDQLSLTMVWDAGEGSTWEVSVVPQDMPADSGTVTTVVHPFHIVDVYSLDTGICYAAYVRQVCDTLRSQWSDSIQFRFEGNTPVFVNDFDRDYTLVSPNPAHTSVNVFSSFHIHKYELYSLKGELMERRAIHANSTIIDVSTCPKGIYLLRLYTPYGETTHKIVVQ
ncbi:MAG: T9SS type A sorting domain-containing protein [Bacteroidales bacterium]|nr:T9SS type A sorting domain-containing protein [Bacteroidales bacterium]